MRSVFIVLLVLLLLLIVAPAASAQWDCEADIVSAYAVADTIFVEHLNAQRNCCSTLTVAMETSEALIDFYEGEAGDFCACTCCFNLSYDASGFAAGHYLVRVWSEDGSQFYGEAEVDVRQGGFVPTVANLDRGSCLTPAEIEEEPAFDEMSWGRIRAVYR